MVFSIIKVIGVTFCIANIIKENFPSWEASHSDEYNYIMKEIPNLFYGKFHMTWKLTDSKILSMDKLDNNYRYMYTTLTQYCNDYNIPPVIRKKAEKKLRSLREECVSEILSY